MNAEQEKKQVSEGLLEVYNYFKVDRKNFAERYQQFILDGINLISGKPREVRIITQMEKIDVNTKVLDEIMSIVCAKLGEVRDHVKSKSRKRNLVKAKQIYCYVASEVTSCDLKKIGRGIIKSYHHSSVIHGRDNIRDLIALKHENNLRQVVNDCISLAREAIYLMTEPDQKTDPVEISLVEIAKHWYGKEAV